MVDVFQTHPVRRFADRRRGFIRQPDFQRLGQRIARIAIVAVGDDRRQAHLHPQVARRLRPEQPPRFTNDGNARLKARHIEVGRNLRRRFMIVHQIFAGAAQLGQHFSSHPFAEPLRFIFT